MLFILCNILFVYLLEATLCEPTIQTHFDIETWRVAGRVGLGTLGLLWTSSTKVRRYSIISIPGNTAISYNQPTQPLRLFL